MPKLSDLFEMRYGHSLELNRLRLASPPDGVNFVGRAMGNNGVTARVVCPEGITPGESGELTVALSGNGVLSTFVQPEPFLSGYHVAILRPRNPGMTLNEKLWWALCIYENRYRYSYGRQANRTLLHLDLPDSTPEFVVSTTTPDVYAGAQSVAPEVSFPAHPTWGAWRLGDLFKIKKGRRLISRERKPGNTPFVGTSTQNNGVVGFVDAAPMFPGGSISVPYNGQGGVGYAFYQPVAFCASDDVQVLLGPEGVEMAALLFVCVVLRHERYRYSFGRKWNMARMNETVIRLPKGNDSRPDWNGMADYIKGVPFSAGALRASAIER